MLVLSNRIFLKNRAQCKTVISHGFFSIFLVYHLKNYITSVNVNILLYIFRNTADKMGLNDAIVEKYFWVCFTLDYLFHRCPWKDSITFKGGTSLSKAFNLISRFSEDIDLILDWHVLGYGKLEPWENRSNTKQDAFNKEANNRAEIFLAEQFCPT